MQNYAITQKFNSVLQIQKMKERFPQFKVSGRNGKYIFFGTLKPSNSISEYVVKIQYNGWRRPKVYIVAPQIMNNAPHRYPDRSICLYHPDNFNWHEHLFIADYIVPWTATWIYFYEIWKCTGIWYADEESHKVTEKKKDKNYDNKVRL
jgi:hypothetical protein